MDSRACVAASNAVTFAAVVLEVLRVFPISSKTLAGAVAAAVGVSVMRWGESDPWSAVQILCRLFAA